MVGGGLRGGTDGVSGVNRGEYMVYRVDRGSRRVSMCAYGVKRGDTSVGDG